MNKHCGEWRWSSCNITCEYEIGYPWARKLMSAIVVTKRTMAEITTELPGGGHIWDSSMFQRLDLQSDDVQKWQSFINVFIIHDLHQFAIGFFGSDSCNFVAAKSALSALFGFPSASHCRCGCFLRAKHGAENYAQGDDKNSCIVNWHVRCSVGFFDFCWCRTAKWKEGTFLEVSPKVSRWVFGQESRCRWGSGKAQVRQVVRFPIEPWKSRHIYGCRKVVAVQLYFSYHYEWIPSGAFSFLDFISSNRLKATTASGLSEGILQTVQASMASHGITQFNHWASGWLIYDGYLLWLMIPLTNLAGHCPLLPRQNDFKVVRYNQPHWTCAADFHIYGWPKCTQEVSKA